jgi:hypothetical protein
LESNVAANIAVEPFGTLNTLPLPRMWLISFYACLILVTQRIQHCQSGTDSNDTVMAYLNSLLGCDWRNSCNNKMESRSQARQIEDCGHTMIVIIIMVVGGGGVIFNAITRK